MAGKVMINKGEMSAICTRLISSVCFFFCFFFLPDDKCCFKARDGLHHLRPESGDMVQHSIFGLTRYLLHSRYQS